jgi:branched-chain amino acid transport system ATP-binding protein
MLTLSDVHAGYATASVLRGVQMRIDSGEVVALLGRNGMGKTTLVRTICGMRPPALSAGSITFSGQDISALHSYEIARLGIGLVPQGRRVFGSLTVDENLRVVQRNGAANGRTGWTVDAVYDFFPRLAERAKENGATLSGGEQQMLAIGRALMTNPTLLVMDEPSEGLAPAVLDVIHDRLQQLRTTGLAVLVAEQNVDLALDLADRVYILGEDGAMVWEGTAKELRDDPDSMQRHLGL